MVCYLKRSLPFEGMVARKTKYDERPKGWKKIYKDDVRLKDTVIESMVNHDLKVADTKKI